MDLRPALLSLCILAGAARGNAAATQPPPARVAGERTAVDLTVYNGNLALVREQRMISLAKGANRAVIPDVPATIMASSLHFASLTDPAAVRVLEQNYQYDLVSQAKLLEKYVGKSVEFRRLDPETRKETVVTGRLLSALGVEAMPQGMGEAPSNPGLVAEVGGKIEVNPAGRLVLPSLPEGLILRPQLEWLLACDKAGDHKAEISYLASAISWSCDYVALLNKDDNRLDLTGWVTLVNSSGTAFKDAGLKLVAGDVNLAREEYQEAPMAKRSVMAASAPQFKQTDVFEYKLYNLQRRTDIADNESKQIELVSARDAAARKLLIYDGLDQNWRYWMGNPEYRTQENFGQQGNAKVGVYVAFRNDARSGLGMPLPKGRVRVYKKDDDGREQFIGEDNVDHTPKDEEVRLYLGNAFDVVGSRAQSDFKTLSSGRVVEETIEIKVRNHKREAAEVMVYEHPWRGTQWEIVKSSAPSEKVDQTTLRFPLKVPADGEKPIVYTIRYSW
jgi:hypothetical protein